MRFITAVLAISPGALFAGVMLAAAPGVTQAMVTEADQDQQRQQGQVQDQGIRGGVPERKLPSRDNNDNDDGGDTVTFEQPRQREPTGKVIISRKSPEKLMKEGKGPAEIQAIRDQGKNEIEQNQVVFTSSEGEGDFQVIEVGMGHEAAFINSIKNNPSMASLYEYVEPSYIHYPDISPNDPILSSQYHHNLMQSYQAWDLETGSANVTIGICDTGLQLDHPDLMENKLEGYNAVSQLWESEGGNVTNVHPHGSYCAGCAAAVGNNGVGISGAGWNFKHRPGRVTDLVTGGAETWVLADCARKMCELPDVKVVSVSYSEPEGESRRAAATYCKTQGALMINSAGNDKRDLSVFGEANNDDLIVVGATTKFEKAAYFSAYGSFVDVWAPGVQIWSSNANSGYQEVSGTSFSCPLVAGVVALIWSKNPDLTPDEVEAILKRSTDNVGDLLDHNTMYGRVNSFKAVQAAATGTIHPTSAPTTPPPTNSPTTPPPTGAPNTPPPTQAPIAIEPTITATFVDGTPKCTAIGGACTSGPYLVNGRGNMDPPEPHNSNTLDSCTDGDNGIYHYDSQNDAVEVSALGGGFLQVGRVAVVKATVWASLPGMETADFYVTEEVGPYPNWVLIGSVKPSGRFARVITSPPFVLTSTLLAVRVRYRYQGVEEPCVTGLPAPWDDVDDLVFAVAPSGPYTPPDSVAPSKAPTSNPTTANPTPSPTATSSCVETIVEIQMDMHPDQISWTIANECTGATVAVGPMATSPNTTFSGTYCLPPAAYQFVISDSVGDGLTGSGSYAVTSGGAPIASGGQFGLSASANFGSCP